MDAFWQSAALSALAKMGEKSQLVALAHATRYSWHTTLRGGREPPQEAAPLIHHAVD